jgi:hypothetical protein
MAETTLSVRQLLGLPAGGSATDTVRAGIPEKELDSLRAQVGKALKGTPFIGLESAVCEKFSNAIEIDPVTLLAEAWEKYSLLSDAAKQSRSGETVLVPMAEHTVQSKLHPYVEIQAAAVGKKKIDFDVTLSLKLKGVVVKVESGEIRAIEAGTCEGSAELGVAGKSLYKYEIKPIPLPGRMKLRIPIHAGHRDGTGHA